MAALQRCRPAGSVAGSLGACHKPGGPRDGTYSAYLLNSVSRFRLLNGRFSKGTHMRRIDLVAGTLEGWSRLDGQQRERFFK